jgi:hypothetical protein
MSIGKRYFHSFIVSLLLVFLVCPVPGQAQSSIPATMVEPPLSLSQVLDYLVQKNVERADALQKYQGKRLYSLEYTGFPTSLHAEMVVDMVYDAPATKQFTIVSQSGSPWVIERILKRLLEAEMESMSEENRARVLLNSSNYDFSGLQHRDTGDSCSYSVAVEPKIPNKLLFRGRVWVDNKDFAVCRIEAEPSKNPSFWIKKTEIHHSYVKVGDFWLPLKNESVSVIRGGGRAVLTIQYQNYEILAARGLKGNDASPSSISLVLPVRPTSAELNSDRAH